MQNSDYNSLSDATVMFSTNTNVTGDSSPTAGEDENESTSLCLSAFAVLAEAYVGSKFEEFAKMCELLKEERFISSQDYPRHAFGYRERFRCFVIVRRNYYRRMMLPLSGHLPWRLRKRLKDR